MAGGVIASIPVLIVFIIAQRYIIQGVARSGLKVARSVQFVRKLSLDDGGADGDVEEGE
jgi:hypothetical protein